MSPLNARSEQDAADAPGPWPRGVSREPSMKIGDVVAALKDEFPALSISKVRFLETEDLITPHRLGNGYRRYSKADMERLRFALTAQRDEYLPLSVIRERLAEMDEEASAPAPVAPRVVASHGRVVSGPLDLESLVAASGATAEEVAERVSLGLVTPDHKGRFDARALRTVVLALKANRMGVPLRNLRTVRSSAERQADVIDQAVQHKRSRSASAGEEAASELAGLMSELHTVLLHRAVDSLS